MIIAVTNLKGGVGKSTLSRNLAVYFALQREKTCIVDTDIEQRTTCDWRNRREEETLPNIDVFPMSSVDGLLQDVKTHQQNGYRVIILDGVPQLEKVTTKMILLANFLVIPLTPSIDDLKSFERFLNRYEDAKMVKPEIPAFLVLNRYGRTTESEEMKAAVRLFEHYGITPLQNVISERVAHKKSSKYGLTALEWDGSKSQTRSDRFLPRDRIQNNRTIGGRLMTKREKRSIADLMNQPAPEENLVKYAVNKIHQQEASPTKEKTVRATVDIPISFHKELKKAAHR